MYMEDNTIKNIFDKSGNIITYNEKIIMTDCEKEFYNTLLKLGDNYKIVPQVNLASIISKDTVSICEDADIYHNELFRNIDFGIFNKDYSDLLLLIELNDSSHNSPDRIKRDERVNNICSIAGINLLTFYTNIKYTDEELINKILDAMIVVI